MEQVPLQRRRPSKWNRDRLKRIAEAKKRDSSPERDAQMEPDGSPSDVFKYIPEKLRCKFRHLAGGIHFPCLPPIPPQLSPVLAPARIPVGIYNDGVAPQRFKDKTARNRVGRLVFLSSKSYDEWQIPCFFGEFGEIAAESDILFQHDYDTVTKRRKAHLKLLSEHGNAIKEQTASYVATVEKYIRDRRFWEYETVSMLFHEQPYRVVFPAPDGEVLDALLEWTPTEDPVLGYGIHKPIPEYDLAEFRALSNPVEWKRKIPSPPFTKSELERILQDRLDAHRAYMSEVDEFRSRDHSS